MSSPPDDGRLVESGSFKVDRTQALDKLMRFQLPDARMYLLPLVQAAVASRASRVRAVKDERGLVVLFDGLPWDPSELEDPYRFLFEEDADGRKARNRELAIALLSVLRLKPAAVRVAFSDGRGEFTLRLESLLKESLGPDPSGALGRLSHSEGAPVRLALAVDMPGPFDAELSHLEGYSRHCPVPIFAPSGRRLNPSPPEDLDAVFRRQVFSEGGLSGMIELSPRCIHESSIDFVTFGVTVSTEKPNLSAVQVAGVLRNDSFRKSLSQIGVVRDEIYQSALALLQRESDKLLRRALGEASLTAETVGAALADPDFQRYWMRWDERPLAERLESILRPLESGAGDPARESKRRMVEKLSLVVACARATCVARRTTMLSQDAGAGLNTLWQAPLLFDLRYRPLSLRALEDQRRWLGLVPYCDDWNETPIENLHVVRSLVPADREFLARFFGADARPMRAALAAGAPPVKPVLEEPNLLIKIPFKSSHAIGEIGLSLTPHTRSSRIRWLRERRPLAVSAWPLGGLRVEAVVECPTLKASPQAGAPDAADAAAAECLSGLMAAAPEAYRRIAGTYDPQSQTPRQALIREHLLDLAVISWEPGRQRWTSNDWLDELALFRDVSGRMLSMRSLREDAAAGRKVFLNHSTHPELLLELTAGYPDHVKTIFASSKLILGIAPPRRKVPIAPEEPAAIPKTAPVTIDVKDETSPSVPNVIPGGTEDGGAAAPPSSAPAPAPPKSDDMVVDHGALLRALLSELAAKGCPFPKEEIEQLDFGSRPNGELIFKDGPGAWRINAAHPLLRLLDAHGDAVGTLPYVVSILYTAVNRASPRFTDEDDVKYQMGLAELSSSKGRR